MWKEKVELDYTICKELESLEENPKLSPASGFL